MEKYTEKNLNTNELIDEIKDLFENRIKKAIKLDILTITKKEKKWYENDISLILLKRYLNMQCLYCGSNKTESYDIRYNSHSCCICHDKLKNNN